MRNALTNILFIALAFLLCGAVEKPFALLRVAVEKVSKGLKSNTHNKLKGA